MGKLSRDSGKVFEREIARTLRTALADFDCAQTIRRSDQTHRANDADVTGIPGIWIECQWARVVTPHAKLQQAIRDSSLAPSMGTRIPVAITRRKGSKTTMVTLRLHDLVQLYGPTRPRTTRGEFPVSIGMTEFLELLRDNLRRLECEQT